jgi:hypothetical protein
MGMVDKKSSRAALLICFHIIVEVFLFIKTEPGGMYGSNAGGCIAKQNGQHLFQ